MISRLLPPTRIERILAGGALADSMGTGLYTTAGIIFFTRVVGLNAAQVGVGMAVAGLAGFLAAVPFGYLADRWGARDVAIGLALVQAALMAAFAAVRSFPGFLLTVTLFCAAERGTWTARSAMVGKLLPGQSRVRAQAYVRSVFNLGVSVGALLAGVALHYDNSTLFTAVILGNAGSFAIYAACTCLLPRVPPASELTDIRWLSLPVLRDWPYLSLGLLNGFLSIHATILLIGLPLWLSEHTDVPRALLSPMFLLNTIMAVAFQLRASRGADTVRGASRALTLSAGATGATCVLFAPAPLVSTWVAVGLLVAGTAALTVGELLQSAGSWGLSFGLTQGDAHGSYQGAFSLGYSLKDTLGPVVVVSLAISFGSVGWLMLCGLFVVAGVLVEPTRRWAQRRTARATPAASARVATARGT